MIDEEFQQTVAEVNGLALAVLHLAEQCGQPFKLGTPVIYHLERGMIVGAKGRHLVVDLETKRGCLLEPESEHLTFLGEPEPEPADPVTQAEPDETIALLKSINEKLELLCKAIIHPSDTEAKALLAVVSVRH